MSKALPVNTAASPAEDLPPPGHRRRSYPLAAMEALRAIDDQLSLTEACGFIYICENEGISLRELGSLLNAQPHTVSRIVGRLSTGFGNRAADLVDVRVLPEDSRVRTLHLTPRGQAVVEELDDLLLTPVPIQLPRP